MATPVVSSIAPTNGPATGGTIVTITGSGLTGAVAVGFGTANATSLAVSSDTQAIAISPPGSGTVNVTVIGPGGQSAVSPAAQFAYTAVAGTTAGPYYADPALTSQVVGSLVSALQSSSSPAAQQAQAILMRRLALQGDVVGSRVPPPLNITEIGGYLNLLATLKEGAIREQALAGILGVAGPSPELGWEEDEPALAMVSIANDRPPGPAQPTLPISVLVRSDFSGPLQTAIQSLHANGATLPVAGPPAITLPPGTPGAIPPGDLLFYLGRVLTLAPAAALAAPATDPLALIRAAGSSNPFAVAANAINPATTPVTPGNYDALQCNSSSCSTVSLTGASFVPLAPVLASGGFYQALPPPQPANNVDVTWTRFTNVTGLVVGSTKFGDELALLYDAGTVARSVFATMQNTIWDGTTFA
jgi:hypothetical protein